MVGICRLCASLRRDDLLTTVLNDATHNVCLQLMTCFRVEISMTDALPKCVCVECVQALNAASVFYTKVNESQLSLASLYMNTKDCEELDVAPSAELYSRISRFTLAEPRGDDDSDDVLLSERCQQGDTSVNGRENEKAEDWDNGHILAEGYELLQLINEQVLPIEKKCLSAHDLQTEQQVYRKQENEIFSETNALKTDEISLDKRWSEEIVMIDRFVEESDFIEEEKDEQLENDWTGHSYRDEVLSICEWKSYVWPCWVCPNVTTGSLHELLEHGEELHGIPHNEMSYKCVDCHKICTRYYTFLNHVRQHHHPALTFHCDVCDATFVDYAEMGEHRQKCASRHPFTVLQCVQCGKSFGSTQMLNVHTRDQHSDVQTRHECAQCGKRFKHTSALHTHSLLHTGEKSYTCELCGICFRQKINLTVHMNKHLDKKAFECRICHKYFKSSWNLEKHGWLHTDVKQFRCDHCDKSFRTKDAKLSHERTHTGEKPYTCFVCDRSFRFRSTFHTHMNLHTGNRPYSCHDCDHHFTNWSNYNTHMKRRHNAAHSRKAGQLLTPAAKDVVKFRKSTKSGKADVDNIFSQVQEGTMCLESDIADSGPIIVAYESEHSSLQK